MINVWEYANTHPRIVVTATDGKEYVGGVIAVWDAVESDDEQDSITIELDSGEIKSFYPDEIESIVVLDERKK